MPEFPHFFMFDGPNSQARGGSLFSWLEMWARYAIKATVALLETGRHSIECRKEVFDKYNAQLDLGLKDFIWETEGASGYYVNSHGRIDSQIPLHPLDYYKLVSEPGLADYTFD